jgi:adenine-specific DNA-methyltransferase
MDNIDVLLDSRNKGQVFTPKDIVSIILDEVGYKGDETLKRSIIEPSFGDGAFLIQIINRIITESKLQDKSNDEIVKIIKSNVFGIEKDTKLFNITIDRLNTLLNNYGLDFID